MPQLVKLAAAELFAGTRAEPREYQTRICASVLSMLDGTWVDRDGTQPDPASSVLIDAPTGAGKTVMGLALAQRAAAQGARVGWAAMRRNLLSQAERMIEQFGFRIPGLQLISMFTHEPPSNLDWLFVARGERVQHHNGVMTSSHTPASGAKMLNIGGDAIRNQFTLQVPLDGDGDPSIYLSILRQVCLNGMVAMTSAFRSDVKVGDDPIYSVRRALATFDNEEGFGAIHQRLEAAQGSPASLREARGLHNVVKNLGISGLMNRYDAVVGDLCGYYGVANLDAISAKKLRLLPARSCRVYDPINLASEIATHHMRTGEHVVNGPKALHGWIGTTICDEYDLEGTANANQDFRDLFLRC